MIKLKWKVNIYEASDTERKNGIPAVKEWIFKTEEEIKDFISNAPVECYDWEIHKEEVLDTPPPVEEPANCKHGTKIINGLNDCVDCINVNNEVFLNKETPSWGTYKK